MSNMDQRSENELVSGGDTRLHYHLEDRIPTHDTLSQLHAVASVTPKTNDYTLTDNDDFINADSSAASITMTLPPAKYGRQFTITKVSAANAVYILPTTPDTIWNTAGAVVTVQWTSLTFKAVDGNWIAI